jgi:hypothetical protein
MTLLVLLSAALGTTLPALALWLADRGAPAR